MNTVVIETRALPTYSEMNERQLTEQRNLLMDQLEGLTNKAKTEKRGLSGKEENLFNQTTDDIRSIDKELQAKRLQFGDTRNMKNLNPVEREEIRAFIDFVRTGESRDLASGNNGAVIPTSIAKKITDKVFEISPLIQEATIFNVGEDLNLPIYDYSQNVTSFLTEFVDIVESSGTFTSVAMSSKIIGTMAKLGKSLVNRTDIDVTAFIVNACAKSVARFIENEIILNTNAKFASTLATGVTQSITTGTTLVIAPEEIVKMKNSIPSIMLPNAKWLMHKDTLSYLQSLKDTQGRFIFGNTLAQDNGNMLLGMPVMLSDAMEKIGVAKRQIYFGDFNEGLAIKLGAQSAEVYKELYAKQYALGIGHFWELDVSASHSVQSISVMIGK